MLSGFLRALTGRAAERDLSYGLVDGYQLMPLLADPASGALEEALLLLPPDELSRAVDGLCLSQQRAPALRAYLDNGPPSELKTVLRGAHQLFLAWEKRGMRVAAQTTDQQMDAFAHYLHLALQALNQPFGTDAYRVEATARLIRVGMGLNQPAFSQDAFEGCRTNEPAHLMAHLYYLRVVSPWWHGSLEELTAFVESVPAGRLRDVLRCAYLHEVHSYLSHTQSIVMANKELRNTYAQPLAQALAGPVLWPDDTLSAIYYNNYLAALHLLLGQLPACQQVLAHLGGRITPYPWHYLGFDSDRAVLRLKKH